jgi:hypothetical protein
LAWVVIAIQIGGEIDAPSGYPIPFYDTFNLITQPAFPQACNHCQRIIHLSLSSQSGEAERRHLDRAPGQKKGPGALASTQP